VEKEAKRIPVQKG